MRRGEFLGKLEAGVASADHQDPAVGDVVRLPVARAVRLKDLRCESVCKLRNVRRLERARGDDDLVGMERPTVYLEEKPAIRGCHSPHVAVELDREPECLRVALEIGGHLAAGRVAVRIAGEGQAREGCRSGGM